MVRLVSRGSTSRYFLYMYTETLLTLKNMFPFSEKPL